MQVVKGQVGKVFFTLLYPVECQSYCIESNHEIYDKAIIMLKSSHCSAGNEVGIMYLADSVVRRLLRYILYFYFVFMLMQTFGGWDDKVGQLHIEDTNSTVERSPDCSPLLIL